MIENWTNYSDSRFTDEETQIITNTWSKVEFELSVYIDYTEQL